MTLWVGELDGDIVVYDIKLQIQGSAYLKLWSLQDNQVFSIERELARQKSRSIKAEQTQAIVKEKYLEWFALHYQTYLSEENEAVSRRRGMSLARTQLGRENFCKKCALPLTANLMNVCGQCGWIKCRHCGTCNCAAPNA